MRDESPGARLLDCDPRVGCADGAQHADHGTPHAHGTLARWCPREMSRHVATGQPDTCPWGQGFQDTGVFDSQSTERVPRPVLIPVSDMRLGGA